MSSIRIGKTAQAMGKAMQNCEITVSQCMDSTCTAIQDKEKDNRFFISLFEEEARKAAAEQDATRKKNTKSTLLSGVPVGIDDNIMTKGRRTTCASRSLEHFVPTFSATAVQRLEEAGMIVVGKLNIDEFSMGHATMTSFFGPTKHPLDRTRAAGASAAAVASGIISCALAADTGGALRQASAQCGVCGLRPTYGTVSRLGLAAFASSMDQIGPIARSVKDCAEIFNIISGKDPADSTSVTTPQIALSDIEACTLSGLRIGVPNEFTEAQVDSFVRAAFLKSVDALRKEGARIEFFSFPELKHAVEAYAVLSCAEAASNLSRIDGIKYGFRAPDSETLSELYEHTRSLGFGADAQSRILLGNYFLSSDRYEKFYLQALRVKALIATGFASAWERFDALIGPVSPSFSPKIDAYDLLCMFEEDFFTVPASLAGLPAASVPCAKTADGLSVGLQVIGPHFSEAQILGIADAFMRLDTQGGKKGAESRT